MEGEITSPDVEEFIIREKGSGTRKTFEDNMAANHLTHVCICRACDDSI